MREFKARTSLMMIGTVREVSVSQRIPVIVWINSYFPSLFGNVFLAKEHDANG
jgi:hypothetical protein